MTPEQQRHTLEMCAKACGIEGEYRSHGIPLKRGPQAYWNPLADTIVGRSQCSEMCAELGMTSEFENELGRATAKIPHGQGGHYRTEWYSDHPTKTAAWQAAACAVAAAIGEAMV
jgi:hypothetical protein